MGFLKVCLYLALIVGCGLFLVHNLPDHSPAPSSQAHFIRPIAKPVSHDGGVFSDRNVFSNLGGVLVYGCLLCLAAFVLWRGVTEYRERGEWTAFLPLVALAVIVGGLWSWFGYFGDHGAFLIWPIVVSLVVIALAFVRAVAVDRQRREDAEGRRVFPDPPKTGGPAKASDFKDW